MFAPLKGAVIAAVLLVGTTSAQIGVDDRQSIDWWTAADVATAERATLERVRDVRGDLGLPLMPPVAEDARPDDIAVADRLYAPSREAQVYASTDGGATLVEKVLSSNVTGTGFVEFIQYQLPTVYDDNLPGGHPLVIAYHGYAGSHQSTALQSTIHVECDNRGYLYMAPIGLDSHFFGPPVTMQHVRAAVDWMIDNFNVDTDRIYMVGFSMGAGVTANFAARHRDPDDLMIAAVGLVSGTYDWVQEYSLTTSGVHFYMEHPLCFQGPPATNLFNYQAASTLHFDPPTYTPATLPGTLLDSLSMGRNLSTFPVYMTWDTGDPLVQVPAANPELRDFFVDLGANVTVDIVSGTPLPHSWDVLDEVALFDFFDGKTANRLPSDVTVLTDVPTTASFITIEPRSAGAFTRVDAEGVVLSDQVLVENVGNASLVQVDVQRAGISGVWPVRATATSADIDGFTLETTNFDDLPSYMLDESLGTLVKGVQSDPIADSLLVDVDGFTTLDVDVVSEPWTGELWTTPNPVPVGAALTLEMDTLPATQSLWLNVGFEELLVGIKDGFTMSSSPLPPALLITFPGALLDPTGALSVGAAIPNDPAFSGLEIFLQFVSIVPGPAVGEVSNMWIMEIE